MKKRILAVIMAIMMMVSVFAPTASAASIASNKKKATGIYGGQTIYITTNNSIGAYTGGMTDLSINIPSEYAFYYQNKKTSSAGNSYSTARIVLTTYKKQGSKWVHYKTTRHICTSTGRVQTTAKDFINRVNFKSCLELPGKNIQYKIVITPEINDVVKEWCGLYKASDMKGITASIDYGKITKVA